MNRYIVKALSLGGKEKVFSKGDEVTEDDFDRDDVSEPTMEQLVKEGFLEVVKSKKLIVGKPKTEKAGKKPKKKGLLEQLTT